MSFRKMLCVCAATAGLFSFSAFAAAPAFNSFTGALTVSGVCVGTDYPDGRPQRAYVNCSDGNIYVFEITTSAQEALYASATSALLKAKHIQVFPISQNTTGASNEYWITRMYLIN